jgi:hypothetical protein
LLQSIIEPRCLGSPHRSPINNNEARNHNGVRQAFAAVFWPTDRTLPIRDLGSRYLLAPYGTVLLENFF